MDGKVEDVSESAASLRLRRGAVSFVEVVDNFSNDRGLSDKGDDFIFAAALTEHGVGLKNASNELSPSFSKSGALLWRQLVCVGSGRGRVFWIV